MVGLSEIELHLPGCRSLKEKRQVIKSIKDRARSRFNISISEVDHHDLWQRATLAIACASITAYQARKILAQVVKQIEGINEVVVLKNTVSIFSPE